MLNIILFLILKNLTLDSKIIFVKTRAWKFSLEYFIYSLIILPNRNKAPALSKGSFEFPHFGDIIQAGHPFWVVQLQDLINLYAVFNSSFRLKNNVSDIPIPPL